MLKRKHDWFLDVVKRTLVEDELKMANKRSEQLDKKIEELEGVLEDLEKRNEKKIKKIKKQEKLKSVVKLFVRYFNVENW